MKTEGKGRKGQLDRRFILGFSSCYSIFLARITMSFQRDKAHHDHGPITQLAQQLHTDSAATSILAGQRRDRRAAAPTKSHLDLVADQL